MFRRRPGLAVRSAGTSPRARRTVSESDIVWASVILVMEEKHQSRLKAAFGQLLHGRAIYVLDVPDEYQYMDPELIELLERSVPPLLGL